MRCKWVSDNPLYIKYHDEEWGIPVYDDIKLFEMLCLEIMQAGLSWEIVLNKREDIRKSFSNFDYQKISKYDEIKIESLMNNKLIIRNKLKIESIINNAKAYIKIINEYQSFSNYIWNFTNNKIIYGTGINTSNNLSDIVSKDLKKHGMKFVGTKIIYAYLQAIGVIYDHDINCYKHKGVESE